MEVTNKCSFPIEVFCWHKVHGYGDEVTIQPGQKDEVKGPYVGEMGGGRCYIHLEGEVSFQEAPDNDDGFQIIPDEPTNLDNGEVGLTATKE